MKSARGIELGSSAWPGIRSVATAGGSASPVVEMIRTDDIAAVMVVVGATSEAGQVIWGTLLQRRVPAEMLGRASSLDFFVSLVMMPASLALASAWDMTRDAEMPARDYVELVLPVLDGLADSTLLRTLVAQVSTAVLTYSAPEHREQLRVAQRLRGRRRCCSRSCR